MENRLFQTLNIPKSRNTDVEFVTLMKIGKENCLVFVHKRFQA